MRMPSRRTGIVVLMMWAAACTRTPEVEKVAVGQDVALTKADGGVVEGTVTKRDETHVQVTTGRTTKSIPAAEIVDAVVIDAAKPAVLPRAARFHEWTVPEGTVLSLRLTSAIDSGTDDVGDEVQATLVEAVSVGRAEVLPAGSTVSGTVAAVTSSGKVKGLARIVVRFTSVAVSGRDDRYDIDATYAQTAEPTKRADATKIGIGAGAGAAIGGLLGGKSGAAKGAAIGGGAGTAAVLATKGTEVRRPAGATLSVRLEKDVDVRVPLT